MLASKSHASLKVPCFYEQIFGGARFARRSLGPGRHLGHIWETPGGRCGSWEIGELVTTKVDGRLQPFAKVPLIC